MRECNKRRCPVGERVPLQRRCRKSYRLRDAIADSVEIMHPVQANIVFVRCAPPAGFLFNDWPIFGPEVYRIVMGFNTSEKDVDDLAQSLIRSRSFAT